MHGTGYIIGEISGVPEGNLPLFQEAKADLLTRGWICIIPQEIPEAKEAMTEALELGLAAVGRPAYKRVMKALTHVLLSADRIFALPGWENSNGARSEVHLALQIGTPVFLWYGRDFVPAEITPRLRVVVEDTGTTGPSERLDRMTA